MHPPYPDNEQWLSMYREMLALLFERNLEDFLVSSFAADMQDAWLRAANNWKQFPERFLAIQEEWSAELDAFNNSVKEDNNPQSIIRNLKQLHSKLDQCLHSIVRETPGISAEDDRLLRFGTRHLVNAMSPDYWPVSNHEVIETFFNSGGTSFTRGFKTFQDDIKESVIGLDVKTAGKDDFKVGETLAITPGEVVFENSMFQLIQYYPFSQEVYPTPLLIVPPWINKYYVLDLTPTNSFVQWTVKQGYTVFMISWVNPGPDQAELTLSDYLIDGCCTAIDAIKEITAEKQVNLAGYCIGGLLAACAAAYLTGRDDRSVRSLTLLNTLLDYSEPGDIGVFISRRMLAALEERLKEDGILDGRILRQMFTMLREDRMFWPYVVNNYMLGKPPKPDPVLYWNQDATNLPLPMLIEMLEDMYHRNVLVTSDHYQLAGARIDLKSIDIPTFILACRRDHIVPWKSAYKSIFQLGGKVDFVLSDAGHVMGVVNSPNTNRNGFWHNTGTDHSEDPGHWMENASWKDGSWWGFWHEWHSSGQKDVVRARFPGEGGKETIERAPGRYVIKTL